MTYKSKFNVYRHLDGKTTQTLSKTKTYQQDDVDNMPRWYVTDYLQPIQ